jgi:hypothetical protein
VDVEVVEEGTTLTLACDLVMKGFIRWADNKPAEQRIIRIASGDKLYRREELGHTDQSQWEVDGKTGKSRDPWQPVMYLPAMDESGELMTFTSGSKGGMDLINKTLRRYAMHVKRLPADYPLVRLASNSYQHSDRTIGRVHVPDFQPAGYVDRAEFLEALEAVGVAVEASDTAALPPPDKHAEFNDSIEF